MKLLSILIFNVSFILTFNLQANWLERKAEGWAWYEDREIKQPKNEKIAQKEEKEISPEVTLTAVEETHLIKKELEEKLARAVLTPNVENVAAYMYEQKKWVDQSADFSKIWTKVLLQQPELDTTISAPVSQYGIQVQKQLQSDNKTHLIQSLVKNYGLFFFYEGKNKRSQAFAQVVQAFAEKYNWQVIAVASDHVLIEGFTNNQSDNGIVRQLGIEIYPSLFLVQPNKSQIIPIAFGLVSLDQIEKNIEVQFLTQEQE